METAKGKGDKDDIENANDELKTETEELEEFIKGIDKEREDHNDSKIEQTEEIDKLNKEDIIDK